MRNTVLALGALALAVFASGCAGPEAKLGRGFGNVTEFSRAGEYERETEQSSLFSGTDTGYTTGTVKGVDKTLARTGIGLYEIITFPLPPYHAVCTDYLQEYPQYPDSYHPRKVAAPMMDNDHYLGFSGGDVAPWFPGSRFRVFDN